MSKYSYKALFLLFTSTLLIFVCSKTEANLTGSFKTSKEPEKVDQRRTVASGSRSSCQQSVKPGTLELLVPEEKVYHKTSNKNPTLYVYSHKKQSVLINFTLVDTSRTNPLYEKQILIDSAGAKSISLPNELGLKEKKNYVWSLAIPCQNDRDSIQTTLSAGIKYFPASNQMTDRLENAESIAEQIQIYAINGIWYQALEKAIEQSNQLGYNNPLQTYNRFFKDGKRN